MKPKLKGWKEGILTIDMISSGDAMAGKEGAKKGDLVRYKRYKNTSTEIGGKYEYHYYDMNNKMIAVARQLFIENQ